MSDAILDQVQSEFDTLAPTLRALLDRAKQHVMDNGGVLRRKSDGKLFKLGWIKLSPMYLLMFEGYPLSKKTLKYSDRRAFYIGHLQDVEIATDVQDGGPSE
jgi:hypothetical protein